MSSVFIQSSIYIFSQKVYGYFWALTVLAAVTFA